MHTTVVSAVDPPSLAMVPLAASDIGLSAADAQILQPDHPFLAHGSWRGFVASAQGQAAARAVASIDPRQQAHQRQVGSIGFIAHHSEPAALRDVLRHAISWLERERAAVIRAPVQLSTWYGHRLPLDPAPDGRHYPLEPPECTGLSDVLADLGFAVAHTAHTYQVTCQRVVDDTADAAAVIASAGCTVRSFRAEAAATELAILHQLAAASFRSSWGFSPMSLPEWERMYRPLVAVMDPTLVLIAEEVTGRAVGFVFAYLAHRPAPGVPEVVIKTIAVDPAVRRRLPGIGWALLHRAHAIAIERGVETGLHALMAEGSYAARVSGRWGHAVRAYATFERGNP